MALGPIFPSVTRGYDTTDHYCINYIDPGLGDDADFDYLLTEAHRWGLHALLNGMFNHVGVDCADSISNTPHNNTPARWFRGCQGRFHTFNTSSRDIPASLPSIPR